MADMTRRSHTGRVRTGCFGTATEIVIDEHGSIDETATIGSWFLHCPGQSPAWDHYVISVVHLREIPGQTRAATITLPHATHQMFIVALDPGALPTADDLTSWRFLHPINLAEQFQVFGDIAAIHLLEASVDAVLAGMLWAEPPLSGQVEPWASTIIRTSAHLRGEEHAS